MIKYNSNIINGDIDKEINDLVKLILINNSKTDIFILSKDEVNIDNEINIKSKRDNIDSLIDDIVKSQNKKTLIIKNLFEFIFNKKDQNRIIDLFNLCNIRQMNIIALNDNKYSCN
jgi:hypothetical protein